MPMSTRQKILDQYKMSQKALDNCAYHLMNINDLAEDQSPFITENVPAVLIALKEMTDVLNALREGL